MATNRRMHANQVDVDEALVGRLVAGSFPEWAGLPIERVESHGSTNAMFRLGEELVARLPIRPSAAQDVLGEQRWLPHLAPWLPVPVPEPLGTGGPTEEYPLPWSVLLWREGVNPRPGRPDAPGQLALDLAEFTNALHWVHPEGAPPSYRAETLRDRAPGIAATLAELCGVIDVGAAEDAWEEALEAPEAGGPPVWIHADLQPGNLLVAPDGRLCGVIDFGCAGLGDAAVDLLPAWYVLPASARPAFRTAVGADDAAWARGRGWALSVALNELLYYRRSNPVMADTARYVIGEVIDSRD
ncbi:aminoglycoside phosphotransferase family protein [Kitasatospora sp. NPDC101183]|uniref:aminoglycoside phosphotransferase family protein n=1 Tax=Kitasatospora sp. NPDC101183 TaxID=3364100 RepID=UPI0037F6EFC8